MMIDFLTVDKAVRLQRLATVFYFPGLQYRLSIVHTQTGTKPEIPGKK